MVNIETVICDMQEKFNIQFTSVSEGKVICEQNICEKQRNYLGLIYGGYLFNIADVTAGVCFLSTKQFGPTIHGSIDYMSSTVSATKLICTATMIKKGRTLSYIDTSITNESGKLLAKGTFQYYQSEKER